MATHQDPDRRVEQARESLAARAEELGRRIQEVRDKLDIKGHIAAHPRAAVGIAFALGMLLGIPGRHARSKLPIEKHEMKSGLVGAAMATLGTLAFQLAKSVAFHQLSGQAKTWWDRRTNDGATDATASRTPDVEAFLQH